MEENNGYPRVLDKKGCLYGASIQKTLLKHEEHQEKKMEKFEKALKAQGRILSGILVALTTASVLMALNLIVLGGP